jgi:16S rRNA G966 N2-methylase RsmD
VTSRGRRRAIAALAAAPFVSLAGPARAQSAVSDVRVDGGPYVPTSSTIVDRMLKLAEVRSRDIVYDLGSGDGRLVIEAARRYGARGLGVEREARLVELARENAKKAGIADRVQFTQDDLFNVDVGGATVVTLYLLPRLLVLLEPKLRKELKSGTRVVSHDYPFERWPTVRTEQFDDEEKLYNMGFGHTALYLYRMPVPSGSAG